MSTATETDVTLETQEGISEPDGKSHYVKIKAIFAGGPVVALCGKKYVPTLVGGAVMDKELCKPCEELFEMVKSMD